MILVNYVVIICALMIIQNCVYCDKNVINEYVSSDILFPERENHIIFALNKTATESTFQALVNGFLRLEEQAQKNFSFTYYDINIAFGNKYNVEFSKKDKLYDTYQQSWCNKNDKCFESSQIENIEETVASFVKFNDSCGSYAFKKFIVIASDICFTFLNKKLDDLEQCLTNYRKIILLLPTKKDVEECKKQFTEELNIEIFSSELTSNEIEIYSNLKVSYQSTWASSTFNIFVMVEQIYMLALSGLFPTIEFEKYDLCNEGSIVAYFQYLADNGPTQKIAKMTGPVNFIDSNNVLQNYLTIIKNAKPETKNCNFINEILTNLNESPTNSYQYNVLVLSDPYLKCLKSDLLWNNTNRHLEIVVFSVKSPESDYSKLIQFSNNSLNHLRFYKPNEGMKKFWGDTSICRTKMPSTTLTETAEIIPSTFLTTQAITNVKSTEKENTVIWWIIGSIISLFSIIFMIIIGRCIWNKKASEKRMSLVLQGKSDSVISVMKTNEEYWKMLLNDDEVIIDFEDVIGEGSKATVYKAILNTSNLLHTFSTIKVAAKVSINCNVHDISGFKNELSSLAALKHCPNIIELKGWILPGNVPVIITELAETNLLTYIKSSEYPKNNLKFKFQILWQICNALKFVAENKFIHRDVACRNVLLTSEKIAKLADFGLCCQIKESDGIFRDSEPTKFPLKWLALESLLQGKFSEKSDVWAFGILCWELFSYGEIPYASMTSGEMTEFLESGQRLSKPFNAPECIYELMLNCWQKKADDRLSFKEICNQLELILEYGYLPLKK